MAFPTDEELNEWKQKRISQGVAPQAVDAFIEKKRRKQEEPVFDHKPQPYFDGVETPTPGVGDFPKPGTGQGKILASSGPVTQGFGVYNPKIERFSGGVNRGTDFGIPSGTKIAAPKGDWVVVEAFGKARKKGFIGNADNRGYGNSVVIANRLTGEKLRFSHLSRIGVRPGQVVKSGQVIALSGRSGNSSGFHIDIEFIDNRGRLRDVRQSRYGGQIT